MTAYPTDTQAKADILAAGRKIYQRGLVAANDGNLSVRVGENALWVTPTGVCKGDMTEDMLVKMTLDGTVLEGTRKPSSETKMHLRIYQENPTVRAVVHAHPPVATTFAAAGIPLDKPVLQEAVVQLGTVPVAPFALPGSQGVADSVAPFCRDYREKYSYKLIYEGISLQEVYNMILELGPGGANGRGSCFGLGCLQWTSYERIKRLVENYIEAADGADTITLAQVQEAEGMTVSYELNNTYRSVYTTWQSENADQNTTEAAFAAGVIVCVRYGVPVGYNTEEVQNTRGALAEAVYNVMMGNS